MNSEAENWDGSPWKCRRKEIDMARIILHKELFDYDSRLRKEFPLICGVDEAGLLQGMFMLLQ